MLQTANSWTLGATVNSYLYKRRYCAAHHTTLFDKVLTPLLLLSLQAKAVRKGRWGGDWLEPFPHQQNFMPSKVSDRSFSCHIVLQLELTLAVFMVVQRDALGQFCKNRAAGGNCYQLGSTVERSVCLKSHKIPWRPKKKQKKVNKRVLHVQCGSACLNLVKGCSNCCQNMVANVMVNKSCFFGA